MPNTFAKRRAHGEGDSFVTQDGGFDTRRNRCIPKVKLSINKKKRYLFTTPASATDIVGIWQGTLHTPKASRDLRLRTRSARTTRETREWWTTASTYSANSNIR